MTGFLPGLQGIGCAVIRVPAPRVAFGFAGFSPAVIFQVALGTSMVTIRFTALSSRRSHHDAVSWAVVLNFTPGVLLGAALDTLPARPVAPPGSPSSSRSS